MTWSKSSPVILVSLGVKVQNCIALSLSVSRMDNLEIEGRLEPRITMCTAENVVRLSPAVGLGLDGDHLPPLLPFHATTLKLGTTILGMMSSRFPISNALLLHQKGALT